ncbi:MAG: adenosylmethionine decarboxylase [Deltaproteobacteria bacterium]|nr:adenosylmethionine decarboxylase [Deltaproteobacteria bacterium]
MQIMGHHALLDVYGCDTDLLNDLDRLKVIFHDTAVRLKCTVVQEVFHRFAPQGVSGVVVIAESHLSVHTWPELGYAAIDLYTCGDPSHLDEMPEILKKALGAERLEFKKHARGFLPKEEAQVG